jgi:hypothetical protein
MGMAEKAEYSAWMRRINIYLFGSASAAIASTPLFSLNGKKVLKHAVLIAGKKGRIGRKGDR